MFPQNRIAVGPHHPLPQSGSLVSSLMTSKSLKWNKRGLIHVYKKDNTRDNTNYKVKTKDNFWSRKTWTWVGKSTTSCYDISSRIIWNWEFLSEILRIKNQFFIYLLSWQSIKPVAKGRITKIFKRTQILSFVYDQCCLFDIKINSAIHL